MTLNEKFENAPIVYDNELHFKKDYESVADEFAIGFAEWVFKLTASDCQSLSTKELLQIYKKEQGL